MSDSLYMEDRPINPNKQYLEQKQLQHKQKKQLHEYLKKHQPLEQVLPCFRDNFAHLKQKKSQHHQKKSKSKAKIYQEIKKKNLQRFGEKKPEKKQPQTKEKKINPLKMTIQYKPKESVFINTNQYKIKEKLNQNIASQQNPKILQKTTSNFNGISEKEKYEKLLEIVHKEKLSLNEEKQNFEKQKQKLEFKKLVQKQQSVPFLNEIKKQIQKKRRQQVNHRDECQMLKDNMKPIQQSNISRIKTSRKKQNENQKYKVQNLNDIQSKIKQLQQQKEEIEDQVYRNKRQIIDPSDVTDTKYSIQKVNQIPVFDIESLRDFIDLRTLLPQGNQFYKIAIEVFETGLSVKQAKMKMKIGDLDLMRESDKNDLNSVNYKRKFQNNIRITKYNNGWIEVWTPGVQRLMANKQLGYKVIWLRNGDIRQQWKNKKLSSYYSKQKEVVQIQYNKFQPIYFFLQLNQLEQYDIVKRTKTVMFREGRIEVFDIDKHGFNGFSA